MRSGLPSEVGVSRPRVTDILRLSSLHGAPPVLSLHSGSLWACRPRPVLPDILPLGCYLGFMQYYRRQWCLVSKV
jgi:hypothetical protein